MNPRACERDPALRFRGHSRPLPQPVLDLRTRETRRCQSDHQYHSSRPSIVAARASSLRSRRTSNASSFRQASNESSSVATHRAATVSRSVSLANASRSFGGIVRIPASPLSFCGPSAMTLTRLSYVPTPMISPSFARLTSVSPFASTVGSRPYGPFATRASSMSSARPAKNSPSTSQNPSVLGGSRSITVWGTFPNTGAPRRPVPGRAGSSRKVGTGRARPPILGEGEKGTPLLHPLRADAFQKDHSSVDRPETLFAWNGDVALAYQVVGEGAVDLVYLQG